MFLVYGDTNSTLAGALTAAKLCLPVIHVEAGLRSFNRSMPEEINRVLTDHLSSLLFAPTENALNTLIRENINPEICFLSGDVMYDAAKYYSEIASGRSSIQSLSIKGSEYVLSTIHRAETTDCQHRLRSVVLALIALGQRHTVIF